MATRVKYTDIRAEWLNSKCLNLIAEYARCAYQVDGTIINVRSNSCLVDVVDHASQSNDITLGFIFKDIQKELRALMMTERLRPKLKALSKAYYALTGNRTNSSPMLN